MAKACGYAVLLKSDREEKFLECAQQETRFGEPVPEFKHSRNAPLVCFVITKKNITHIALGRRGNSAGSGLRRLNLEKTEELPVPITINKLLKHLPNRTKATIKKRMTSGGLLTEKGFDAVVTAVRKIAPQSSSTLDRYSQERAELVAKFSPKVRENLAQQKEAVLTALSIAGISREPIQEWEPSDETPVSFLDGLPSTRLREDPMVVHDMMHLPGYEVIKTFPYNAVVFESDSERLTVILANRLPLEKQTGTDLIYFNETFQSFVMVQYKAMEREDEESDPPEAVFRLPNAQLAEEISRMDELLATLKAYPACNDINGFRLTENPFFLKLCPRLVFKPDDIGLVPGMYLPLDYWKRLEQHPGIKGKRNGLQVTYKNAGRHFDNTAFTTIVAKAWVGTTPSQSEALKEVIRKTLETGKAAVIAIKPKMAQDVAKAANANSDEEINE